MPRPKVDLPAAADIRALADGAGRLAIRVTPGARSETIAIEDGRVLVKIRAQPQDGAANDAVLELLARALDIAPSKLHLLRGATSRLKPVQLGGAYDSVALRLSRSRSANPSPTPTAIATDRSASTVSTKVSNNSTRSAMGTAQ